MSARMLAALVAAIATALVALLAPTTALADEGEPPAAGVLANATLSVDRVSLTTFTVTATCRAQDERPSVGCTGEIRVHFTGDNTKRILVGSAPIDAPVGSPVAVTINSNRVLDFLVAANLRGKLDSARLDASHAYTDPGADIVNDIDITAKSLFVQRSFANYYTCGLPRQVTMRTTKAPTQIVETTVGSRQYVDTRTHTGTKLDTLYSYRANAATTVALNGLTYVFAKGSEFHIRCMGVGPNNARLKRFPVAYVERGTVTVKGRPTARVQINSGVSTPVGMFSADSRAAVDFTVVSVRPNRAGSNPRAIHATVRSRRGRLTARQVFRIAPSAHCTPGRAIRMYIDGRTVSVR